MPQTPLVPCPPPHTPDSLPQPAASITCIHRPEHHSLSITVSSSLPPSLSPRLWRLCEPSQPRLSSLSQAHYLLVAMAAVWWVLAAWRRRQVLVYLVTGEQYLRPVIDVVRAALLGSLSPECARLWALGGCVLHYSGDKDAHPDRRPSGRLQGWRGHLANLTPHI